MKKQNQKAFYQSHPGVFADITTHDLLILDPQLTSLCPEKIYTQGLLQVLKHKETGMNSGWLAVL